MQAGRLGHRMTCMCMCLGVKAAVGTVIGVCRPHKVKSVLGEVLDMVFTTAAAGWCTAVTVCMFCCRLVWCVSRLQATL
jgi:hypothetical protein